MYLDAFREEVSAIEGVDEVARTDSAFEVSTGTPITSVELCALLKAAFAGDFFDKLRFVSVAKA
ncbi:MAG: hypothetical protein K0S57_3533 [Ramlibacter sp.]|nr:hypothetical protein [Ramlibacter sp.]